MKIIEKIQQNLIRIGFGLLTVGNFILSVKADGVEQETCVVGPYGIVTCEKFRSAFVENEVIMIAIALFVVGVSIMAINKVVLQKLELQYK